ncbi:MAG: hypothetical protein LC679_15950, partial [Intrasporangiaceae bacterium]|nr:hypothetical protein [Intrasporangiaceae bacterium]
MALLEDHLKLEVMPLDRNLPPDEPVVQGEVAEVVVHQLARVDDVAAAMLIELVPGHQHLLDGRQEHRLVLPCVEELLHQIRHVVSGRWFVSEFESSDRAPALP